MLVTQKTLSQLDFKTHKMLPAIIQDHETGIILMQGYMTFEALQETLQKEKVTFFSRSKQRLWLKGETSKNYLIVKSIHTDCDKDSILVLAHPTGVICHLGTQSCFPNAKPHLAFLGELNRIIKEKRTADPKTSYTASLFSQDISRSAQKVGEEGVEVALAAVKQDKEELLNESADLLYHLSILLQHSDISLNEVIQCLENRHQQK
jgi:phosphoribosyl-ATP pyrophosphohydrolase/phosphoribosyl-AMP cyclohydrolase